MTCSTGKRVSRRTSSAIRTEQMGWGIQSEAQHTADLAGISPEGIREYYQVGVTNRTGTPNTFEGAVIRERNAYYEIINGIEIDKISGAIYKIIKENVYFLTYRIK